MWSVSNLKDNRDKWLTEVPLPYQSQVLASSPSITGDPWLLPALLTYPLTLNLSSLGTGLSFSFSSFWSYISQPFWLCCLGSWLYSWLLVPSLAPPPLFLFCSTPVSLLSWSTSAWTLSDNSSSYLHNHNSYPYFHSVRGQFVDISSLLPLCGSWKIKPRSSGLKASTFTCWATLSTRSVAF